MAHDNIGEYLFQKNHAIEGLPIYRGLSDMQAYQQFGEPKEYYVGPPAALSEFASPRRPIYRYKQQEYRNPNVPTLSFLEWLIKQLQGNLWGQRNLPEQQLEHWYNRQQQLPPQPTIGM